MTAKDFLSKIDTYDETLEANLTTMLQSVRCTKQFWFLKKSDLQCMTQQWGSPTLFLTFSCAEYDSEDVGTYLRKVNGVDYDYPIGKLCSEDPVSVSRKFSKKFHDFFNSVIIKGQALGKVDHFYWKKEYQSRGAPHYHILVWIEGAPVIGKDSEEEVLQWIRKRITCRIPNEDTNPELHRLVKKFQLHRCSKYCKRKRNHPYHQQQQYQLSNFGNSFLAHEKFDVPDGDPYWYEYASTVSYYSNFSLYRW